MHLPRKLNESCIIRHTRDNYALTKQKSTQITIKLRKKQTRATSEGIPSSFDIEFLELNVNLYLFCYYFLNKMFIQKPIISLE